MGFRTGYLRVLPGNERAVGFYRRRGWSPDGRTKIDDRFELPVSEVRCSTDLTGPSNRKGA